MVANGGGKVLVFGSFRLGVNTKDADVDALLVAPWFIDRSAFFDSFHRQLRDHPEVTEVTCVPEAFVPIMKLKFRGLEIDLLFAQMLQQSIPDDFKFLHCTDELTAEHLRRMDAESVRSLNGVRVTEALLGLVPDSEVFKSSLRVIRAWAKAKQLCSNVLGFPGGVSWAILTARICQLFPRACAAMIVQKFFFVFSQWDWPRPVLLKRCSSLDFLETWQVMPIITPADPAQNSTYNVTASALKVIQEAFAEALAIIKKNNFRRAAWAELFTATDFFPLYQIYIEVAAESEDAGLVEARMRHLVIGLDHNPAVKVAHLNTQVSSCDSKLMKLSLFLIAFLDHLFLSRG